MLNLVHDRGMGEAGPARKEHLLAALEARLGVWLSFGAAAVGSLVALHVRSELDSIGQTGR